MSASSPAEVHPAVIAGRATAALELTQYGLANVCLSVTDFAFVKTFRLMNESRWSYGESLDLQKAGGK